MVLCSVPSREVAIKLINLILRPDQPEASLAACINILPGVESHYIWKGSIDVSQEFLLFMKTQTSKYLALEALIQKHHPYECPEILVFDVHAGAEAYLKWIYTCTSLEPLKK
ncbi:MAG: divalent-cation tolerance protein CutA [Gammaproteobacteria bacterium]